VAACVHQAAEDPLAGGSPSPDGGTDLGTHDEVDDQLDGRIAPDTGLTEDEAPDAETVVEAALLDVQDFWRRHFRDVYGQPYEPISGGFWAYGPATEVPPCGTPPPSYADIAGNAFYCPPDDLVAWDAVNLVPDLYEEFGGFTLGIVFAHELGHAVQARAGILDLPTVVAELQADCFAGAWTSDVADGGSDFFEVTVEDLDKTVAGFLTLRDGVGTSAQDPTAHGTGFDRIGAFSEGYEGGVEACAAYPDRFEQGDLVIVEIPFGSQADFERGGDLPLSELVPALLADLEDFWKVVFSEMGEAWTPVADVVPVDPETDEVTCGETYSGKELVNAAFYCVDDNTVYIDDVNLVPALDEIGDYAVATEIARQYAYAAQSRLGNLESSRASNLQADCYTGVYAASGFLANREDQQLVLSPGDLDEAVIAFLQRSDATDDPEASDADISVGTAFERFDAFRSGFMQGLPACEALLEGG
jgi:predicted metalloprotease